MKGIMTVSASLMSLTLLCSCVDSGSSAGNPGFTQNEVIATDGSNVQGHYAADIWPVNYNLHFKTIGKVAVSREEDTFTARVKMQYGPKGTRVKQALYTARRCPNLNDDLNKDAYIDILEARLAIGKITIPFDADLDSQMGGYPVFPTIGVDGKMDYEQTASFSRMFEDLKGVDDDMSDQMVKLKDTEGITIPGRIVLFQGVPESVTLPESVATTDGESAHDSIPVGCAVLWKVESLPSEFVSTAE